MVQQTLKLSFWAADVLKLRAAARPATARANRRDLRMEDLQFGLGRAELRGTSQSRGAFSRAFVPPCNLAGGRQLSDQSSAFADRNPSQPLQIVVPRTRSPGQLLHEIPKAKGVPRLRNASGAGLSGVGLWF
ncbi:hypothetical protein Pres01_07950 [Metapseudomonas resinovorans]|nr:hypothetical protein Pres01_07950 [Pseudomonas resinovorans]